MLWKFKVLTKILWKTLEFRTVNQGDMVLKKTLVELKSIQHFIFHPLSVISAYIYG